VSRSGQVPEVRVTEPVKRHDAVQLGKMLQSHRLSPRSVESQEQEEWRALRTCENDPISSAEDFYHVEQLRHLLGNKLTRPLTVIGHLRNGKRVSRQVIGRAIRDLRTIAEQFETQSKKPSR